MVLIYNPECILGNYCISYGTSIHGYEGSTAEEYAQRFSLDFVLLKDKTDDHPDEFILGDVDADMQVSVIDATAIQLHLALIRSLPTKALSCADTDKDGEVSVLDATQIQLFIAQLIPSL